MLYEMWQLFFMLVFSAKKFQGTYGHRCARDRVSQKVSSVYNIQSEHNYVVLSSIIQS